MGNQGYNQNQINEKSIIKASKNMCSLIEQILGTSFAIDDVDNFSSINLKIFGEEQKYYSSNHCFQLLSLLTISFLDLGILTIEQ